MYGSLGLAYSLLSLFLVWPCSVLRTFNMSKNLSMNITNVCCCRASIAIGQKEWQMVSLLLSGQNWRMESYKYHCHSVPMWWYNCWNSSTASVHGSFSSLNVTSGESLHCLGRTSPGDKDDTRKWWNFFMPLIFFIQEQRSLSSYMWEWWYFHLHTLLADKSCSQLMSWRLGLLQADFPLLFFCSCVWIIQSTNLGQISCGQRE